ncbi:hypothetical protein VP01_1152g11 [Puccinia sorghi]|uniref:Uncharacterized protein n=1 Tax=Puccinia sorghi TaxID=27349 RepID=A0A0L6VRR7_9BASI|nr:hypothetical protein VP01_1152g11 [Puccinia sorghi]
MVRNAGKFGKPKRGGKKQFTKDLAESDRAGMWDGEESGTEEGSGSGTESLSGESSGEEEELATKLATSSLGDGGGGSSSTTAADPTQSRAERKAAKKLAAGKLQSKSTPADPQHDNSDPDDLAIGNTNRIPVKSVKLSQIDALDSGPLNRKESDGFGCQEARDTINDN